MCQAKSGKYPNGKRCLKHSKLSQYIVRVVSQQFNTDERTVTQTLSELEREGRGLPQASGSEALELVNSWKFDTATDELSNHERTIRTNQLEKAHEEVKDGVAGSRLYAWKNLAKRVGAKLRKFAVIGFLTPTLALSACSGGTVTPSPSTSPTGSPTTSQSATPAPTSTAPVSTAKTVAGSGQVVKDKYGSYEKAAPVVPKFDSEELVDNSWKTAGFSLDQVKSARKFISEFVTTQGVDSSAADGDESQWQAWVKDEAPKYIKADQLSQVTQDHTDGTRSGVIYNNPLNAIEPTTRDGGVRLTKDSPYINSITGYKSPFKRLQIEGNVVAAYRVSPASAQASLKKARPKATEAELRKQFPEAFNAKEDKLTVSFDFTYSVSPDGDGWKINGYSTTYKTEYAYN